MIGGLLEIEIMNGVWDLHEIDEDMNISVSDVVAYLKRNDISRAYTTIKTVMDRLCTKELLIRYRDGKKFYYKSMYEREEIAKKALQDVADNLFNGSYIQMLRFAEKQCEELLVRR